MKTVLITGANGGLGKAIAYEFASRSWNLILVQRRPEEMELLAQEYRESFAISVVLLEQDLGFEGSAGKLFEQVESLHLKVDVLINNAGFGMHCNFISVNYGEHQSMLRVNLDALMELSYLFGKEMCRRGSGVIINIASLASFIAGPYMSVYFASKAFVRSFSEGLAEELKGKGVRVAVICPGPTATQFEKRASLQNSKMFRLLKVESAESVAAMVYRAVGGKKVVYHHGLTTKLANIATRLVPRSLSRRIAAYINGYL